MPADSPETCATLWVAGSQVVTWLLVVGGWVYTNRTNNARESRKELRAAIDKVQSSIDDLVELGHQYYLAKPEDSWPQGNTINARLSRMSSAIQNIGARHENIKSDELGRVQMAFMDSLTGGDFQSGNRQSVQTDNPKLNSITAAAIAIHNELERLFSSPD